MKRHETLVMRNGAGQCEKVQTRQGRCERMQEDVAVVLLKTDVILVK
jgi:hypothetical protein